jgi:hypothetical protein
MSNPMPGWYPDPEAPERQRFWDGTKWTEARAYPILNVAQPAVVAPAPAPLPDEKRKSNPWIVVALIAALAAVLFAMAWFFVLRDSGSQTEPEAPPTAPAATPTDPVAPPLTEEPIPPPSE